MWTRDTALITPVHDFKTGDVVILKGQRQRMTVSASLFPGTREVSTAWIDGIGKTQYGRFDCDMLQRIQA